MAYLRRAVTTSSLDAFGFGHPTLYFWLRAWSGGLRPIAIGYTLRRVAAKCANRYAVNKLAPFFAPLQVCIATPAGCEAAVHAARKYVTAMPQDHVFVKLDFSNAFNSLHRDVMLQSAYTVIPEIYSFVHQSYSSASMLKFGSFSISSQLGPQQGDPLGPLLFCLPLQPVLHSLTSDLRMGYFRGSQPMARRAKTAPPTPHNKPP